MPGGRSVVWLAVLLTLGWASLAQAGHDELSRLTVDSHDGIGQSRQGVYTLNGTPGQPDAAGTPAATSSALTGRLLLTATLTPTPTDYAVSGSVAIEEVFCCVSGKVRIDAHFGAWSPVGDVTEMRAVAEQYSTTLPVCRKESEMAGIPWEPFVVAKTFSLWPIGHYVPLRVSAQYRDAAGHLSPVYCDNTLLIIPTPTVSPTPTVTPTPTSVRVTDLSVSVEDSADPVSSGQVFQYVVTLRNHGPALAPSSSIEGQLSSPGGVTFTGTYNGPAFDYWPNRCDINETHFTCFLQWFPQGATSIALDAVVSLLPPRGQESLCVDISFSPPLDGGDSEPGKQPRRRRDGGRAGRCLSDHWSDRPAGSKRRQGCRNSGRWHAGGRDGVRWPVHRWEPDPRQLRRNRRS